MTFIRHILAIFLLLTTGFAAAQVSNQEAAGKSVALELSSELSSKSAANWLSYRDAYKAMLWFEKYGKGILRFIYRSIIIPDEHILWMFHAIQAGRHLIQKHEIKLIYEESKEGKRIIEMKQNDVNAAEEELTQAKLAVDPLEKKERELRKKQSVYIKNEENMNNVISKSELKVKRMKEKVEDLENIIEESHSELKLLDEIRKRDENELTKIEATIKGTTEEIGRRTKNIPQANLNLSEIKMKLIELNSNEATLSDDISDTSNELNKYHNEIQTKTKKMGELKNAKQIFRQKLNNMMNSNKYDNKKIRDCLTLMDYFDREQDTLIANGTLRGEVFGPVGFYMKVSSPECVIMIEKSVPLKKLLSFVSSCDEDDRFVRSVIKRLNVDIDNFCMKNLEMPRPTHTENSLKSFKVIGYSVCLLLLSLSILVTMCLL